MNWIQFSLDVVINVAITGILLYVIQKVFDERASKRLTKFEANLRSAAFERETRFVKHHESQAEVVAELYKGLVQVQSGLYSFAHAMDSDMLRHTKGEKGRTAKETIDGFWNYFKEHGIHLSESSGKRIREFYRQSMLAYVNLCSADIFQELSSNDESYQKKYAKDLAEAERILADEISPVREDIEREFRSLLGS